MQPVTLITGPAGVGKTTVAREWAERQKRPAVHLSLDSMRERVASGFQDPQEGWNDEAKRQYRIARDACAAVAKLYCEHGFACVIDDAVFPDWPDVSLAGWQKALSPIAVELVVLVADLEVLQLRNTRRIDSRRLLLPDAITTIAGDMEGWRTTCPERIVDTTSMTAGDVVDAVTRILES